jgi:hypothetical protein
MHTDIWKNKNINVQSFDQSVSYSFAETNCTPHKLNLGANAVTISADAEIKDFSPKLLL